MEKDLQVEAYNENAVMEENKLIAEFVGLKIVDWEEWNKALGSPKMYTVAKEEDLKYDYCWNWLMPVVEEIDHLEYESERLTKIDNAIKTRSIKNVYKAVVEFIKWYNKNK